LLELIMVASRKHDAAQDEKMVSGLTGFVDVDLVDEVRFVRTRFAECAHG
jgi:hypothetical protein